MKTVKDKLITEMIPLRSAQNGDRLWIPRTAGWSSYGCGDIEVVKIKTITKGKVQIKFRSSFSRGKGTVQKMDVPGDVFVQRTRKIDDRDGNPVIVIDPAKVEILI